MLEESVKSAALANTDHMIAAMRARVNSATTDARHEVTGLPLKRILYSFINSYT